jgi:NitT/TauT family transport system substrate-binding protein
VQAFVNATQHGWLDYLNGNPAPANALIKRDNPEASDALIRQAIGKLKAYGVAISGDAVTLGLGTMTDARWTLFFDTMVKDGIYNRALDYRKAYDLRFVRAMPMNFQ